MPQKSLWSCGWTSGRCHGDLDHVGISSRWSCAWRAQATRRFFSLGDRKTIWKTIWKIIWKITVCLPRTADDDISTVICHHGVCWHQPAERWWVDESYAVCFAPRHCLPQVARYSLGQQGKGCNSSGNSERFGNLNQWSVRNLFRSPSISLMSRSHSQRGHVWIHTFR